MSNQTNQMRRIFSQRTIAWTAFAHYLLFVLVCCAISWSNAQDDPDNPDNPELVYRREANFYQNDVSGTESEYGDQLGLRNISSLASPRSKRQWGCPNGCFSPCLNSAQCQRYQLATVCVLGCCCPAKQTDLSTACDGDPAVAACLNGLCGQGYFCNARNFCCRCQSGTSPGPCVNNLCPPGFACNTNQFCCSLGSGSVLGPCVNGQCPPGYQCGAGNLCYPVANTGINTVIGTGTGTTATATG